MAIDMDSAASDNPNVEATSPSGVVDVVGSHEASRAVFFVSREEALPPPPPGVRYVAVPRLGTVVADDALRHRVDRFFHTPMIVLALLVLPLLLMDVLYIREGDPESGELATQGWMWWVFIIGMTIIWLAFTVEFIVKVSLAESRTEYLRRNWLDVVIIAIPLLRPLRLASVARTTKVFRLRGVGFKLARYLFSIIIGLEATERMARRFGVKVAAREKDPAQMTRHELMTEVKRLRRLCEAWRRWHAAEQDYLASQGRASFDEPPPRLDGEALEREIADAVHEAERPSHHSTE